MKLRAFLVSEITQYLKRSLEADAILHQVQVVGEVAGLNRHHSGHIYFDLKDDNARLPAVIFNQHVAQLKTPLANGDQILAGGRISVYPRDGKLSFYVTQAEPVGRGEAYLAFEALKKELLEKGYFDRERKKEVPRFAGHVGVITSLSGAVLHDILTVAARRSPLTAFTVYGVPVQGEHVSEAIGAALRTADRQGHDCLIIARGGGNIEDFKPFNSRELVEVMAHLTTPIVSAVGHETDITLCDLVADYRAATPSEGAEYVTADRNQQLMHLDRDLERLLKGMHLTLQQKKSQLERFNPQAYIAGQRQQLKVEGLALADQLERLIGSIQRQQVQRKTALDTLADSLDQLSPLNTLKRGYALVQDDQGFLVTEVQKVCPGTSLHILLQSGGLTCVVDSVSGDAAFQMAAGGMTQDGADAEAASVLANNLGCKE